MTSPAGGQPFGVPTVQAVVAPVETGERLGAAQLGDPRAGNRGHRPLLADQRAGEPRQHGILGHPDRSPRAPRPRCRRRSARTRAACAESRRTCRGSACRPFAPPRSPPARRPRRGRACRGQPTARRTRPRRAPRRCPSAPSRRRRRTASARAPRPARGASGSWGRGRPDGDAGHQQHPSLYRHAMQCQDAFVQIIGCPQRGHGSSVPPGIRHSSAGCLTAGVVTCCIAAP